MMQNLKGETMDWNKLVVISAQCVAMVTLGVLVACGHNSLITDGLLVVTGSIAGVGVYQAVAKSK